jgi:anti-sigma B factor antagonist
MTFETTERGKATIIAIAGNMMGGPDVTALNEKLHGLLDAGKKQVVLDMQGVQFINSSGLSLLLGAVSTMKKAGGGLSLAGASEKVLGLIKLTKLTQVFATFATVEEAIAGIKS